LYNPVDFLYHNFHSYPEVRERKEISLPDLVKMYRSENKMLRSRKRSLAIKMNKIKLSAVGLPHLMDKEWNESESKICTIKGTI